MQVGTIVLEKYRIDRVIGEGGMGVVVAATNLEIGQPVALKLLRPDRIRDDEAIERVMREARASVQLRGEHTGRIFDVARLPTGEPVLVMELLDGEDLSAMIARGAIAERDAADLLIQACQGLAEAHAVGIIHRDLKPSNLFLAHEIDGTTKLKVIDFGVAKATTGEAQLTRTTSLVGSVAYMSPEQLRKRPIDIRSDIWSLGVVLQELVVGRHPFPAESVTDASIKIAVEEPEALPINIASELRAAVARCLDKDPENRFANVAELAAALAPLVEDGTEKALRVQRVLGAAARSSSSRPIAPTNVAAKPPAVTPAPAQPKAARPAVPPSTASRRKIGMIALGVGVAAAGAVGVIAATSGHGDPIIDSVPDIATTSTTRSIPIADEDVAANDTPRLARMALRKPYRKVMGDSLEKPLDSLVAVDARRRVLELERGSGLLSTRQGGMYASITGTGDFSSGLEGGMLGSEPGEMQGGWGYGIKGTGPGGGGTGMGTIGTGRYGTMGHGSGTGSGYGKGGGRFGKTNAPKVQIGNASASGDLDKNIIRRYIRQKLPQIEYCYQKELTTKPALAGRVTAQFRIGGNGAVEVATASGLDATVDACVASVIKTIQFPKPTGGGVVNVVYPFTFKQAGN